MAELAAVGDVIGVELNTDITMGSRFAASAPASWSSGNTMRWQLDSAFIQVQFAVGSSHHILLICIKNLSGDAIQNGMCGGILQ